MVALQRFGTGESPVASAKLNLIVDALTGAGNTPVNHGGVNDPVNYALTAKNQDPAGKVAILYAPNGSTVLLQVTAAGVLASPDGIAAAAPVLTTASSIQSAQLAANAATQRAGPVTGTTASPTTASGTYATIPEMTATLTTTGGELDVDMVVAISHSTTTMASNYGFSLDGAAEVGGISTILGAAGDRQIVHIFWTYTGLSAAAHTVTGRWSVTAGTVTAIGTQRWLRLIERKH